MIKPLENPAEILELEKKFDIKFKKFDLEIVEKDPNFSMTSSPYFVVDINNEIVRLNCSYCSINDLSEIVRMVNLTNLNLNGTNVINISPLENLTKLTHLSLMGTRVSDVSVLTKLTNLVELELSKTDIREVSALAGLSNLTHLYLVYTKVNDICVVGNLSKLKTLILIGTEVTDVSCLRNLLNLSSLYLTGTNVIDVSSLGSLSNLTELILNETNVSDISGLTGLNNLTGLHLNRTKVSDISALSKLNNLTDLNLGKTQVIDLSALKELEKLTSLSLRDTKVSDLSNLKRLTKLNSLDLSGTNVSDISALAGLNNLTSLFLSRTRISDISSLLGMINLNRLFLDETEVSDISSLAGMINLTSLHLNDTNVEDINILRGFKELRQLCINECNIKDLHQVEQLCQIQQLEEVNFVGNPLPIEPGILNNLEQLRARFADSKKGITEHRNLKLIFLGDGCSGKSTLYSHLRDGIAIDIPINVRTDGVAINSWIGAFPNVTVNVWDFGGQDVFHGTHRLFLGQRAIYIVVYTKSDLKKCSKKDTHPLRYWLDFIADYGQGSRVLLVENVIENKFNDSFPDDFELAELVAIYTERGIQLDTTQYRFDCKNDNKAVRKFKKGLEAEIESLLEQYPIESYPKNRHQVQVAVEYLKQVEKTISNVRFKELCKQYQISNASVLLDYFTMTGVVSYFPSLYQDRIILQTHWVLEAIYKLISIKDTNPLKRSNGKLTDEDLQIAWIDYEDDERELFKSYLLKSGLMADLKTNDKWKELNRDYRYLMPALFSEVWPVDMVEWEEKSNYFSVRFNFIFGSIMERMQVAVLKYCHPQQNERFYKNFIKLVDKQLQKGAVECCEETKEIKVWAESSNLYMKIFSDLDKIYPLERARICEYKGGQDLEVKYTKERIGSIRFESEYQNKSERVVNLTKTDIYLALVQKIREGKVLIFAGTGVSAYSTGGASLATWRGLLENGIEKCHKLVLSGCDDRWLNRKKEDLATNDLEEWLSVAELITNRLKTARQFKTWLQENVGSLKLVNSDLIAEMGKLNSPIFTTNYDNLIRDALGRDYITNRDSDKIQQVLTGKRNAIVHLHGHWDVTDSVVLGVRSYQELGSNPFFQALEKAISLTKHILFVGYGAGLDDPNFGNLLKWSKLHIDSEHHHYRLLLEKDAHINSTDPKIQNIVYGTSYNDIVGFFEELNKDVTD